MALPELATSKVEHEAVATARANKTDDPVVRQLARAMKLSNRLRAEDLMRESEFMLPQDQNVINLLESLARKDQPDAF